MALRPGTTLDGELVIWRDGVLDFAAVQSRAASTPTRARALAEDLPASFPTGVRTGSWADPRGAIG
jgi:ATP-dependent DNA ligase